MLLALLEGKKRHLKGRVAILKEKEERGKKYIDVKRKKKGKEGKKEEEIVLLLG